MDYSANPPRGRNPLASTETRSHMQRSNIWQDFFSAWPSIDWSTDPTTHATILEQEIQKRLHKHFPMTGPKKRNTIQFSMETWHLFKDRNRLRRLLAGHGQSLRALQHARAINAWRAGNLLPAADARDVVYALQIAVLWKKYGKLQQSIRKAVKTDRATYLHQAMTSLDHATKSNVMHLLKPFRLGKRVKDLNKRHRPMVELENGKLAQTPAEAIQRDGEDTTLKWREAQK